MGAREISHESLVWCDCLYHLTAAVDQTCYQMKYISPLYVYLPVRASKQGNVIGLVSIYTIYMCVYQKNCNLAKGSDLPQVVPTDFFLSWQKLRCLSAALATLQFMPH